MSDEGLHLEPDQRERLNHAPVAAPDVPEAEHYITCPACGQRLDLRRLGDVLHHEEPDHEPIRMTSYDLWLAMEAFEPEELPSAGDITAWADATGMSEAEVKAIYCARNGEPADCFERNTWC